MRLLRWICALGFLTACGDDTPPPPGVDAATRDAFVRDAGQDTGSDSGGDSAVDATDAGIDAGVDAGFDAGFDAGPPPCAAPVVDVFELATASTPRPRRVHVAAGADRFVVSWEENRLGQRDVFSRVVPAAGPLGDEVAITDSFDVTEEPAVLDRSDGVWVVYRDNRAGNFEVYLERRMADLSIGEAAQRLTMDAIRNERPLITAAGAGALVAWSDSNGLGMSELRAAAVDGSGSVGTVQAPLPGRAASQVRMRPWDDGAAVAFAEPRDEGGIDAHVVRLAPDGTAAGTAAPMSASGAVSGTVDVAQSGGGGLFVFGAATPAGGREVRLRPLNSAARPRGPDEQPLLTDIDTSDPSVVGWGEGFAVSYRALAGADLAEPAIRVSFVDAFGRLSDTLELATAAGRESPTWIEASDGVLVVAWADVTAETTIRAARIRCE